MNITTYLNNKGFNKFEGYSQENKNQSNDLINFIKDENLLNVMEIGFNAGHSAELFLSNNDKIHLTSFDLGLHDYVYHAKDYINLIFPDKHTLILGDSTLQIPKFIQQNPNVKFDLIFIDGGHAYGTAKSDLINSIKLSHDKTLIIMDDTIYQKKLARKHNIGPTKVWIENINKKKIKEIGRREYETGRGMSWGNIL